LSRLISPSVCLTHTKLEGVPVTERQENFSVGRGAAASSQRQSGPSLQPPRGMTRVPAREPARLTAGHFPSRLSLFYLRLREVDELLRMRPELGDVVREVHPEVSFCELAGEPMKYHKASLPGREERRRVLLRFFPELHVIVESGRDQGVPVEDILDATVACWSALRLVGGEGRSLPTVVPFDTVGLPMAIWV
jgi:predicted RNase H-like nuclease